MLLLQLNSVAQNDLTVIYLLFCKIFLSSLAKILRNVTSNLFLDKTLVVDNLKPTEIVVSFSAVSKWNDIPGPPAREESRANMKHKDRDSKMAEALTADSSSVLDGR